MVDYETDFYAWALHNAQLLRAGKLSEIDVEHIAEELESMGKRDRQELESRLIVLMGHLLKWQYQLKQISEIWPWQGESWRASITEQRIRTAKLLRNNPSLKPYLSQAVTHAYPDAVKLAVTDTQIPIDRFPPECPYSLAELLDDDFYPQ